MGLFDFFSKKKPESQETSPDKQLLQKVEVIPGLSIPKAFALEWTEIAKSKLPYISISATPNTDTALEQSKFGAYPYLPIDFDYPKDEENRFMYPLAQINFKEVPVLEGFPTSGYLQFYISAFDDVYGLNFDDPQAQVNFKVFYFTEEEIVRNMVDFSFLDVVMIAPAIPIYKPHELSFTLNEEYVGIGDVRHEENASANLLTIAEKYPSIEDELVEAAYDSFSSGGHKIGGYADFTQEDPRINNDKFRDFILLLQIDTDDDIMWGDSGIANFFIHPDDLARRDFSKVMYNWDCC